MMFTTDRDLLAMEPNVFVDVPVIGQELLRAEDGEANGTTLSSVTSDFAALSIDAGHVLVVSDLTVEVVARVDAQTLTVSLPRIAPADIAIAPPLSGTVEFAIRTFQPQAVCAHQRLRQVIGLADFELEDLTGSRTLVDTPQTRRLEVLATLAEIYRIAQAPLNDDRMFAARHRHYEKAFATALAESGAPIDVNQDGAADLLGTTGVRTLRRT